MRLWKSGSPSTRLAHAFYITPQPLQPSIDRFFSSSCDNQSPDDGYRLLIGLSTDTIVHSCPVRRSFHSVGFIELSSFKLVALRKMESGDKFGRKPCMINLFWRMALEAEREAVFCQTQLGRSSSFTMPSSDCATTTQTGKYWGQGSRWNAIQVSGLYDGQRTVLHSLLCDPVSVSFPGISFLQYCQQPIDGPATRAFRRPIGAGQ